MTLQRATVQWDPDTYYFLSPNGEDWLEVTAESFHQSVNFRESAARQVQEKLDGQDGTMPIRLARRYLQLLGAEPGKSVSFVD